MAFTSPNISMTPYIACPYIYLKHTHTGTCLFPIRVFCHWINRQMLKRNLFTLIALTRLAVLLATSFALCTKWRFATGLAVFEDARRQALQRADVCLATTVAADKTCKKRRLMMDNWSTDKRPLNSLQATQVNVCKYLLNFFAVEADIKQSTVNLMT